MKQSFRLSYFIAVLFLCGCNSQLSDEEIVISYYSALNEGNFDQVKDYIADSLYFIEGEQKVKLSRDSYYNYFQWDSVFQPQFKVLDIETIDDYVQVRLESKSDRLKFLEHNPLVTEQQIRFSDQKITRVEYTKYIDVDWSLWSTKRDSLIKWMEIHHPEHPEFINDLTKTGAENYLKAIALFQASQKK